MVSEQAIEQFLNKKVFVKLVDESKVQVGILKKIGGDFFLESPWHKTAIEPSQVARITYEGA